jgi:hypothetical protein
MVSLRRALAVLIGVCGFALAARFCHSGSCAIPVFFALAGVLCATSSLWCWALPVALVVGDLYPWTGSLLVNERDLFLISTLAVLMWRTDINTSVLKSHKGLWTLLIPLAVSVGVSCVRGWQDLPPSLIGDDFSLYGSQWNALRVAKGFAFGIMLFPFLVAEIMQAPNRFRLFAHGVQTSALIVAAAVIYERAISVGLFDLRQLYRATGTFFSMHTGGQHIDAYWAIALPFLFLPPHRRPLWLHWLIRLVLLVIVYYAIVATMSRAIIIWAAVATFILVPLNFVVRTRELTSRQTVTLVILAMMIFGAGVLSVFQSEPIITRFRQSRDDLQLRWRQWQALGSTANHGWMATMFGNGLGAVPSIASRAFGQPQRPAELIAVETGEAALRIHPGRKVYVEQLVDAQAPGPWSLQGSVRHAGSTGLHMFVCEKTLFDSFRCVESSIIPQGRGDAWQPFKRSIDLHTLPSAANGSWLNCPLTIAFSASGENGPVDIMSLHLTDAAGSVLLRNADFHLQSSHWFFTSDDHASWRAENVWVHMYLEQGLFGVVSFAWLMLGTIAQLARQLLVARDISLGVLLTALIGFLAIGMFGSLLDTPWIVQLLCAVLAVSQACLAQRAIK